MATLASCALGPPRRFSEYFIMCKVALFVTAWYLPVLSVYTRCQLSHLVLKEDLITCNSEGEAGCAEAGVVCWGLPPNPAHLFSVFFLCSCCFCMFVFVYGFTLYLCKEY